MSYYKEKKGGFESPPLASRDRFKLDFVG